MSPLYLKQVLREGNTEASSLLSPVKSVSSSQELLVGTGERGRERKTSTQKGLSKGCLILTMQCVTSFWFSAQQLKFFYCKGNRNTFGDILNIGKNAREQENVSILPFIILSAFPSSHFSLLSFSSLCPNLISFHKI